jgi:hypothetical protein
MEAKVEATAAGAPHVESKRCVYGDRTARSLVNEVAKLLPGGIMM